MERDTGVEPPSLYLACPLAMFEQRTRFGPTTFRLACQIIELVTVIGSNHFSLGDYIKQDLESHQNLPIGIQLIIVLRELITYDLILQLNALKSHVGIKSFIDFLPM
ncbi:hypothetical protein HYU92_04285 [Candidatus Curtissbacteria bacterium]|nr:hypothetical protein [Candidatus Curtissbacteria bacterium]